MASSDCNLGLKEKSLLGEKPSSRKIEALEKDIKQGVMTISQLLAQKGVQGGICLNKDFETTALSVLATDKALKYKVGQTLAKGGMGVVLDAKDLNCRRKVAMKVISDDQQGSVDQVLRFIVEAQICAQLEHPGIVPVYELGVDATGSVFYTMKLVKGETLVDVLIEIKNGNQEYVEKYPLLRLLNIYLRVCDAVAFAHSKNVVHRDLKPENVMVGDYGEVLVMDWGLAKILDGDNPNQLTDSQTISHDSAPSTDYDTVDSILTDGPFGDSMKTMHGQIMGTPGFMPPEQALGKVNEIDSRSDIYALGGILYNILALQPPVTGLSIKQVIRKIIRGDIRIPFSLNSEEEFPHCPSKKIPEPLSAISMKALSSLPADRYRKVEDLQRDVEKYLGGFATSAEDAGFLKLLILLVKRNKKKVISGFLVLFMVISIITGFMFKLVEAKTIAEQHLHKFVSEHSVRKEISRKLLMTAIQDLKQDNPKQKKFSYRYSLLDKDFSLNLQNNRQLLNINPLQELPLTDLKLANAQVENLEALKGMPLRRLDISGTMVRDLTPIEGLPLIYLNLSNTPLQNLKPILHLNIEYLDISKTSVVDFEGLNNLPLKELILEGKQLRKIKNLKALQLDHLVLVDAVSTDLKSLANMSIGSLEIRGRQFNDLNALRHTTMQRLSLVGTKVKDLGPLIGTNLESLKVINGILSNIEGIQYLSLKELVLEKCYYLKDLSPLANCHELERLLIPKHATGIEFLQYLKNLQILANNLQEYEENFTATEFWERFDADFE